MKHTKSRMSDMISDYQKMYDAIKNWNETSSLTKNEEGHYIYGMGWAIGDMGYHGWSSEAAQNEIYHYKEVRKAHKALKIALQNTLGIEQVEKEY